MTEQSQKSRLCLDSLHHTMAHCLQQWPIKQSRVSRLTPLSQLTTPEAACQKRNRLA